LFFFATLTEPEATQNLQLVSEKNHDMKDDHASAFSVDDADSLSMPLRIAVKADFPIATESEDAQSQAVIVIPPSSSDLSEASVCTAPASLNININLECPNTATGVKDIIILPSSSSEAENKPPNQFKRSASYDDLVDKGVDFEEKDIFDHIRLASAGMEFQGKHNPRLRVDHRPSFGATIDNVEWFRSSGRRPCPRGGWLTRMAKGGDGYKETGSATSTPANGVYRTTNGFTFQC